MRLLPAFLLMEDAGARMPAEAKPLFDHLNGRFEAGNIGSFAFRRVQARHGQVLLAARAFGRGLRIRLTIETELIKDEAAQLGLFDMFVVPRVHRVTGAPCDIDALGTGRDHGSPPSLTLTGALSTSCRIAFTSSQA